MGLDLQRALRPDYPPGESEAATGGCVCVCTQACNVGKRGRVCVCVCA